MTFPNPDFRAEVTVADDPFVLDAHTPPVRYTVTADWAGWSSPRGIVIECRAPGADPYFVHELPLDEAEAYGKAILDAAAARRAHPPTPADDLLNAYEQFAHEHEHDPAPWISVDELRTRTGMTTEALAAALAPMHEAGHLEYEPVDGEEAAVRLRPHPGYGAFWEHESRAILAS